MPTSQTFEERYNKLTKHQREAVDAIEGPVMVIAGPGTGKTTILTLRIAQILRKTDTDPDSILALTFTESGVISMRKKLRELIGPSAHKVHIHTFHSFCERVIKEYPDYFPAVIGSNHISDVGQIDLIKTIILEGGFNHLRPYGNPEFYVGPARSAIKDLKRENVSPEEFLGLIDTQEKDFEKIPDLHHKKGAYEGRMKGKYEKLQKSIEKNKELQKIYKKYQDELGSSNLYDYEDMIMEVVDALEKNEALSLSLQEQFQYVLADEHQDANRAQNALLERLTSFFEAPNLFIVGDEKQAIFRFQGASLENFLYFREKFPHNTLIVLEDNFRSTQNILDASHSLIENNPAPFKELRVQLNAWSEHSEKKIQVFEYETHTHELSSIARMIRSDIDEGVDPGEIAVLFRNNRDADAYIPHLERESIPYVLESRVNILEDPLVAKTLLLLETIDTYGNNEPLVKLLYFKGLGTSPVDVHKVVQYARKEFLDIVEVLSDMKHLKKAGVRESEILHDIHRKLLYWKQEADLKPLFEIFPHIIKNFGILKASLSGASHTSLGQLQRLFKEIKMLSRTQPLFSLSNFLSHIETVVEHGADMQSEAGNYFVSGVHLMTAHRSKGLEFDHVYIVGVYDGHWGNKRTSHYFNIPIEGLSSEGFDANEDERRLLYVAITRARKNATLSFPRYSEEGKELLPSQFLEELDDKCVSRQKVSLEEGESAVEIVPAEKIELPVPHEDYIRSLFLERNFSVTALNNFLACPWRYFFQNLVRIPEAPNKFQTYGTAVHEALRFFFESYKKEKDIDKEKLLSFFKRSLRKHTHSKNEFEELLEKGKESLSGYIDAYRGSFTRTLIAEYRISGVELPVEGKDREEKVLLSGQLDKVELLGESRVNVVDYKTGVPKSRNEIEGKTKNSNGDYKRQLVFYKMLLDRVPDGKYSMVSGELDFVEPNIRGNYKKERFEIGEEEAEELWKLTQECARAIYNLSFWNEYCDKKDCEYCALRRQMENS